MYILSRKQSFWFLLLLFLSSTRAPRIYFATIPTIISILKYTFFFSSSLSCDLNKFFDFNGRVMIFFIALLDTVAFKSRFDSVELLAKNGLQWVQSAVVSDTKKIAEIVKQDDTENICAKNFSSCQVITFCLKNLELKRFFRFSEPP